MARTDDLTLIEQATMLAILRRYPHAYGVSIRDEIKTRTGKDYSFGSIYAVLERLEDRGLIKSREGEATAVRGGRRKLFFTITGMGQLALSASIQAVEAMREGVDLQGALA